MIKDKKELMTLLSRERLQKELQKLKQKLIEAGQAVGATDGDWHDGASFDQAQRDFNLIQTQIEIIEEELKNVEIIKPNLATDCIGIGHEVEVYDGESTKVFTILGPSDFDPVKSWVSFKSPIGESLLDCKKGDKIGKNTIVDFRPGKF